jgi:hypothetical protein
VPTVSMPVDKAVSPMLMSCCFASTSTPWNQYLMLFY